MGSGWSSAADSTEAAVVSAAAFEASFAGNSNVVMNSGLSYVISEGSGLLDLVPSAALPGGTAAENPWFDQVDYAGAFDSSEECTWLDGWSMLSARGFIGCSTNIQEAEVSTFQIYPNPSNGTFSIRFEANMDDAIGRPDRKAGSQSNRECCKRQRGRIECCRCGFRDVHHER